MSSTANQTVPPPAQDSGNRARHSWPFGPRTRRAAGVLSAAALAGTCLLAGAVPAQAATGVSTTEGTLRVVAATGKANNITVSVVNIPLQGPVYRVRDTGDSLTAGPGCDQITSSTVHCSPNNLTHASVDARDGNDTVAFTANVELKAVVHGGTGKDTITGGKARDDLHGGDGRDILDGRAGNDRMHGDADNDTLTGNTGNDTLNGGAGHDGLYGQAGNDTLNGDDGEDRLDGNAGNDTLYGDNGDDRLRGNEGNDYLNGGAGNDNPLDGGLGDDTVHGGAGNDLLRGDYGTDWLYGNAGRDTVNGVDGWFDGTINGGSDRDTCKADLLEPTVNCED
jgi:Ca2+-binding RTX toxin-like protein